MIQSLTPGFRNTAAALVWSTTAPQVHFVRTQFKWTTTHKVVMLSSLNWKTRCKIIKYIGHILYVVIALVQVGASQSTAPTINNSMTDEDSNVRTCGNLLSGMKRGFFLVCSRLLYRNDHDQKTEPTLSVQNQRWSMPVCFWLISY